MGNMGKKGCLDGGMGELMVFGKTIGLNKFLEKIEKGENL